MPNTFFQGGRKIFIGRFAPPVALVTGLVGLQHNNTVLYRSVRMAYCSSSAWLAVLRWCVLFVSGGTEHQIRKCRVKGLIPRNLAGAREMQAGSVGPQDVRGPPANSGSNGVSCQYKASSINVRQQFMS